MIYVVIQFGCIIYLIINAQFDHLDVLSTSFIMLSIIIGLLAVVNMRLSNLNIVPTLKDKHQLASFVTLCIPVYCYFVWRLL